MLLVILLVCCGGPIALDRFPALQQYPVSASLPQSFSDLDLRDDSASQQAADRLEAQLKSDGASSDAVFAGVYGDGNGKRVTLFGVTGWRWVPGTDVSSELNRLDDEYNLSDVQSFNTGQLGVHESCGIGRDNDTSVVVCAWADHGSLATVLLTRRKLSESAELVNRLRQAVLVPSAKL